MTMCLELCIEPERGSTALARTARSQDRACSAKPTAARATKETAPHIRIGQGKPTFERFLLKVDGLTKTSLTTLEASEKAG